MSYFSTVPDALAALVAMFATAPGLDGVEVIDGPPVKDSSALESVAVGYSPSDGVDAVEMTSGFGDLGSSRDRESYTVHCTLGVLNGDRDTLTARTRAYQLYDAVGFVITDDPTLRKTVMKASLGAHNFAQNDTNGGLLARVDFSVTVDAFTGR